MEQLTWNVKIDRQVTYTSSGVHTDANLDISRYLLLLQMLIWTFSLQVEEFQAEHSSWILKIVSPH